MKRDLTIKGASKFEEVGFKFLLLKDCSPKIDLPSVSTNLATKTEGGDYKENKDPAKTRKVKRTFIEIHEDQEGQEEREKQEEEKKSKESK